jgi:hypothetical protein
MKYLKLLICVVFYTFVTLVITILTPVCAIFEGKKAFGGLKQIFDIWKLLFNFLITDTSRVTENYQLKLHGKYKKFKNTEYISINFNNFDLGEFLLIGYFTIYASMLTYVIACGIISAITYTAIYVNAEVEVSKTPIKKPVITYHKFADEVNMDTYCPCTPSFKMKKNELLKTKNTLLLDDANGEVHVAKENFISKSAMSTAKREYSQGEYTVTNIDSQITFSMPNALQFKVNHYQGFVFMYDLSSVFFFNEKGEMFRIPKK